jgi:HK97 gp10 family phage protein
VAAADSGVSVEGVDHAARAYQGIADDSRNMTEAHRRIADAGEQAARSRAPRRTGAMAGSIDSRATAAYAELVIGVSYWPAQEFGTRYVTGRRFMESGIEAMRATAPDAYNDRMAKIIEAHT